MDFRQKQKNIYFSQEKKWVGVQWSWYQILFRCWLIYVKLTKRNFSKSEEELKNNLSKLNFSGNTIDIAGGSGSISQFWKPNNPKDCYVVVDPLFRKSITDQKAYKEGKLIYYQAYAENLPFKDKPFDLALIAASLDHVNDPQKTLSEANRVLNNAGHLLIIQKIHNSKTSYDLGHIKTFSAEEVDNLLKNASFKIEKKLFSKDNQVAFIWSKKIGA